MPIGRYENPHIRRLRNDGGDRTIAAIAALQGGQVHRRQLVAAGLGPRAIDRRIASGRLYPSSPSTYGVGHPRDDREAKLHAAVLTCGDGAALSHRAGGEWLGILGAGTGLIEVTTPRQLRPRRGIRPIWRVLPGDEVTVVRGLAVTSAARTLFDLAATLPERLLRRALTEAEVQGFSGEIALPGLLERHPRSPGCAAIRALIADVGQPVTVVPSDGEDLFAAMIGRASLPKPAHRYGIAVPGGWVEVDFAWPELRVAVEVDSSFHDIATRREEDQLRDQALTAAGWIVFRTSWWQLTRAPDGVARRLRAVLDRAARQRSLRNPPPPSRT